MISSASDYKFVTGDLNLIRIDGSIMPLRTGNTGKTYSNGTAIPRSAIMRGEDIAFLLEALGERKGAMQSLAYSSYPTENPTYVNPSYVSAFSRKLDYSVLVRRNNKGLYYDIKKLFTNNGTAFWLKNFPATTESINAGSLNPGAHTRPDQIYSNTYLSINDWTGSDPSTTDKRLQRSLISNLFAAVKKMREGMTFGYDDLDNSTVQVSYEETEVDDTDGTTTTRTRTVSRTRWNIMEDWYTKGRGYREWYTIYGPGLIESFAYWRPWCTSANHLCVFKVVRTQGMNSTFWFVYMPLMLPASARDIADAVMTKLNLSHPSHSGSNSENIKINLVACYRHLFLTNHTQWS